MAVKTKEQKNAAIALAAKLGISAALLEAYPELQAVKLAIDKGDETEATKVLFNTNWYQNIRNKTRVVQKLEQPGVYKGDLDAYTLATRKRLAAQGITLDEVTLKEYADTAFELGLTDSQFDNKIIQESKTGKIGGAIGGVTAELQSYANSFGVGRLLNSSYWEQKKKDLFAGTITAEDIQAEVRNTSASMFPAYAEQIQNGVSVDSLASSYKGTIASILEVDADAITYDNQYLKRALQYVDKDGKPGIKPLWQFEKELRSTNEWQYTNNARDSIDSMGLKVLRDWGMA